MPSSESQQVQDGGGDGSWIRGKNISGFVAAVDGGSGEIVTLLLFSCRKVEPEGLLCGIGYILACVFRIHGLGH